ncbi:MAG: hypothetical protein R3B13_00365 [Polyangiaceae bacterium]
MTPSARDLLHASKRELMELLRSGHDIDPAALHDTEYKGTSLGLPRWVERLTWKKFKKTFHHDPSRNVLRGWNVRLEQNALDEPCVPRLKHGTPVTFGHYQVVSPAQFRIPEGCDHGLLIHYGLGGNGRLDPMTRVRDPLVALEAGDTRLLLGWSYVDIGWCLGTPSFFTLEYDGPLARVVEAPLSMATVQC